MFNIDFDYIIQILLPVKLRKIRLFQFLKLSVSYVKTVYDSFTVFRTAKLYDINFTGQTCYLEKKLRDTFATPGLHIDDGYIIDPTYLSNKSEGDLPTFFCNKLGGYDTPLFANSTENAESPDFLVVIPDSEFVTLSQDQLRQMRAIINYYLIYGKLYTIKNEST